MSASEDRLRKRLKRAGAKDAKPADDELTEEIITLALDELRKRERIRTRALGARIKSLKEQVDRLRAQRDQNALHVRSASRNSETSGTPNDRISEFRDEITKATALVLAAEKTETGEDGKELSDSVLGLQRVTRYMVWILGVGMGIVVPGMLLLLVLAVMRLQIP